MNTVTPELLQAMTQKLVTELNPISVYLFGSHAWGKPTAESDVDLMVLLPETAEKTHEQYMRARKALRFARVPLDIFVGSQAEFNRFRTVSVSLQHKIAKEGRLLYER